MDSSPYGRIRHLRGERFQQEMEAHFLHGFVLSTPDAFLVGRPIVMDAPHGLQASPWHRFQAAEVDCWLVWFFSGDLSKVMGMVPYRLPWLAWARRDGPLRFFPFDTVLAKVGKGR